MIPEDTIILGTPGSGGFGYVWLAERRHPFVQRVALKFVKAGMDSKAVVACFALDDLRVVDQ
ncbi:MAG: hypothetical protein CK544_05675 [Planctomycetaceae bacterium]|nr:MAG: hypothetical protein CK544_05675 [Planctomycetaceae bacterium]